MGNGQLPPTPPAHVAQPHHRAVGLVQEQGVLDDKPEPRRDDGGGLGSALDPASSDPEPELLVAYRQALWQSES
jgi:hypothetical protein